MATPRTGLTRKEGMKFAFTLGAAFAVLAAVAAWRHRMITAKVLFALSACFLLLGMAVPARLGPVQRAWMTLGHAIGQVTSPIVLGAMYFLALSPVAYLRRTFGRSPLSRNPTAATYWIPRTQLGAEERRRALERQF
jgi:hypothetical protein